MTLLISPDIFDLIDFFACCALFYLALPWLVWPGLVWLSFVHVCFYYSGVFIKPGTRIVSLTFMGKQNKTKFSHSIHNLGAKDEKKDIYFQTFKASL